MNDQQRRELESIVSALCDGVIDQQQHARLEQLLRADADCRRAYLQYVDLHARLTSHPNLTSGIPLTDAADGDGLCELTDDAVLERARLAIEADGLDSWRPTPRSGLTSRFLLLTLLVAVSVGGWYWFDVHQQRQIPVLREVAGDVFIETRLGSVAAEEGRRLKPGERLKTADEASHVVLEYADGTLVTVNVQSQVGVPPRSSGIHLQLAAGTMWSVPEGHSTLVINAEHRPRGIAWSEELSRLATAGGDVRVWECKLP